jgi:hypothetical protein
MSISFGPDDPDLDAWIAAEPRAPAKPEPLSKPAAKTAGHITYHPDLIQGSEEWHAARCGLLTASEMKFIITPTLKVASNDKERAHLYELLAQRITRYVEPSYVSDDMLRGKEDEIYARALYAEHYAPVTDMGFITNNRWGFTIGCSPDGLVGEDGALEAKSRRQKFQIETIIENVPEDAVPPDFGIQVQTTLLVTERKWVDFISYSNGMHMLTIRMFPITEVQDAIVNAAGEFEKRLALKMERYKAVLASGARLIPTERRIIQEIHL